MADEPANQQAGASLVARSAGGQEAQSFNGPAAAATGQKVAGTPSPPTSYVQAAAVAPTPAPAAAPTSVPGAAETTNGPAESGSSAAPLPEGAVPPATTAVAPGAPRTGASSELPNVSLYVGDLHPDVVEQNLFELFSSVGPVVSVRVCRDVVTRRSLGYAYVNFQSAEDAERAMDVLNYYEGPLTKDKAIRIMWKRSDPSNRRNPEGNVFIKNLSKEVDNKSLYDTFSAFGKVLSCKLGTNDRGESLGYAFVHFEDAEVAKLVIAKTNGMLLAGQKMYVSEFIPRWERAAAGEAAIKFTNVYVKNLDESLCNQEELTKLFSPFGSITSIFVPTETVRERRRRSQPGDDDAAASSKQGEDKDAAGGNEGAAAATAAADEYEVVEVTRPRGFAFVNFEKPDHAAAAVSALNGMQLQGRELYVGRSQKKSEREAMLRSQKEQERVERQQKLADTNLFVKNLSDDVDEDRLREEFSRFGTITSLRIMRDERGQSRGFGFVAFSQPDEAIKAVTEMNLRIVGQKPVYVAPAQRKEQRRAQIEASRAAMMRAQMGYMMPGMGAAAPPSMYPQMVAAGMAPPPPPPGAFAYPYGMAPMQPPMGMGRGGPPMPPGMAANYASLGAGSGGGGQAPGMDASAMAALQRSMAGMHMSMPMGMHGRMPYGVAAMPPGAGGNASGPMGAPGMMMRAAPRQARVGGRGGGAAGVNNGGAAVGMAAGGPGYKMPGRAGAPMGGMLGMAPMGGMPGAPGMAPMGGMPGAAPGATAPLTVQMLANADPKQQKQMLGERLYPLVYHRLVRQNKRDLAPKITGMLLEMDNSEVLHLVESPEALHEKIDEALEVLEQHLASMRAKEATASAGGSGEQQAAATDAQPEPPRSSAAADAPSPGAAPSA
ncbi:hypothetical protein CDCA_CDCA09G2841 [Cyanidium caldarium]|uniref:PABP n=1 Tax=Cyanidium caldarium TaxID=2771 RepID=A0AAV9IXK3_CYACA|nr:hypothetical protein CDCA_CDCA09G2841 [Cyanidium caldarium]